MSVPNNNRPPNDSRGALRRQPNAGGKPLASKLAPPRGEEEAAGFNPLHLLLVLPLLLLMLGMLLHDAFFVAEDTTPVVEIVRDQPIKKTTAARKPTSDYTVNVKEHPAEFDRSVSKPTEVQVSISEETVERPPVKELPAKVEITGEDTSFVPSQAAGEVAVDKRPRVVWQWGGMEFGITAVDSGKLITFAPNGGTNQTLVRVNGQAVPLGGPNGKIVERDTRLPPDPTGKTFGSSKTVWVGGKLVFTVILDLVPSKQPVLVGGKQVRLLDTVQVRYIIENKDAKAHTIGLRMMLDTLIGSNDGVPFTVPGQTGLVTSFADFPKSGPIPDFIQALEVPNLQNPGTIAHLSLKLGNGIEVPSRVSLTHWGPTPAFEVPLSPLTGDSAVIMYWKDQSLKAGEKRTMGFAYGLGSVSSTEPGGKLGLTLGGNFNPGETFSATAYVQNPVKDQKLTLDLPKGLERVEGQETQPVPAASQGSNNTSIVTWKVKVLQTGTFPLKVVSSTGQTQARTINIARAEAEPESKLTVNLAGAFEPGKEFTVEAKLASGPQPPALTLKLPAGLVQLGEPAIDTKPSADKKETVTMTRWKVKVVEPGKYAVRVEAANGLAVTKTLSIVQPALQTGGEVTVALEPPFAPNQAFTLRATVKKPLEGQTLTFALPPNLRFIEGQEKMAVSAKESICVISWKVLVEKPGTFPLCVQSSNGITLRRTIAIEKREEGGGTFDLTWAGAIEPGKAFTLKATVTQPVKGQKLTLTLPKELEVVDGSLVRVVPAAANGTSTVSWSIRVLDKGTLPIRVVSSTGMSRALTITLRAPAGSGDKGIFGGGP